jgi:hypothetical protein
MIKEKKINYEIDLNFKGYANPSQTIDMDTKLPAPKPLGTPSHENKFQNIKNYKDIDQNFINPSKQNN